MIKVVTHLGLTQTWPGEEYSYEREGLVVHVYRGEKKCCNIVGTYFGPDSVIRIDEGYSQVYTQ